MLKPNTDRVLVKPLNEQPATTSGVLIPGQFKAGENLFVGTIADPGDTEFKVGQLIYYSEYSASAILDVMPMFKDKVSLSSIMGEKNGYIVVAKDDIMAYDDDLEFKVTNTEKELNVKSRIIGG